MIARVVAHAVALALALFPTLSFAATLADPSRKPAANPLPGRITQRHVGEITGVPGYQLIMMTDTYDPGAGTGLHTHPGDQTLFVDAGELTVTLGAAPAMVYHQGETIHIPAGTVHAIYNLSDSPAREFETLILQKEKPAITRIVP